MLLSGRNYNSLLLELLKPALWLEGCWSTRGASLARQVPNTLLSHFGEILFIVYVESLDRTI